MYHSLVMRTQRKYNATELGILHERLCTAFSECADLKKMKHSSP